jgi:hypothetical protein
MSYQVTKELADCYEELNYKQQNVFGLFKVQHLPSARSRHNYHCI